jgi:hypothetical protein
VTPTCHGVPGEGPVGAPDKGGERPGVENVKRARVRETGIEGLCGEK